MDLSRAAFEQIADLKDGVIKIAIRETKSNGR
jgi:rare lipoprotein A (peptidoglycan hydrolase)